MISGLLLQALPEDFTIKVVQLEPLKVERREEGMEVVMPQLVEVGMMAGVEVVCLRTGVLQVREGSLGARPEEAEIPEGKGEERIAMS